MRSKYAQYKRSTADLGDNQVGFSLAAWRSFVHSTVAVLFGRVVASSFHYTLYTGKLIQATPQQGDFVYEEYTGLD